MKYHIVIRYIGTDFHGFQFQPNVRTVQGELNEAMQKTFGVPCRVTGCSRTDAGVHAQGFSLTVDAPGATIPPHRVAIASVPYLPVDIGIVSVRACAPDFHPRYDCVSKEYRYRIANARVPDPFLYKRAWFLPKPITDDALLQVREAMTAFIGKHDFSAFMADGSDVDSTVREVFSFTVERFGDALEFRIRADGFLYHMVRIIVGTMIDVAFGRICAADLPAIIDSHDRTRAGMTAPPEGLYLYKVYYPNDLD